MPIRGKEILVTASIRAGLTRSDAQQEVDRFCASVEDAPQGSRMESSAVEKYSIFFPAIDSYASYMLIRELGHQPTIRFIDCITNDDFCQAQAQYLAVELEKQRERLGLPPD